MVLIEDPARLDDVEVVVGPHVPRELGHPVEVRPDPSVLRRLLGGPLQATELTLGLLAHVVGHAGARDLVAEGLDDVLAAVLAELLADRAHLLAEDGLALSLLEALGHVFADLLLQLGLGKRVPRPAEHELQTLLDVERLEDLHLLLERQVGRVAGGVRHLSGFVDPAEELGDRGDAAGLHDALDRGAVLARQLPRPVGRRLVLDRLDLDPGRLTGSRHAHADLGPAHAADHDRLGAAAQAADVLDLADRADPGVAALQARHEQEQALFAGGRVHRGASIRGFQRQGDDHPRQHDAGGQGQQGKGEGVDLGHVVAPSSGNDVHLQERPVRRRHSRCVIFITPPGATVSVPAGQRAARSARATCRRASIGCPAWETPSSAPRASGSRSGTCTRSRGSTSRSRRAPCSACSAPTAPARRRPSAS